MKISFQLIFKDGFLSQDEVKDVLKSAITKVSIKFDDQLIEELCQNLVSGIVEKYQNKGLSDLVYCETFLEFISEDETLQEMIVTNIDKSLQPKLAKKKTSAFMTNINHYTSPEYLQNNSQSIITVTVFLSILALSMIIRGKQFFGNSWSYFNPRTSINSNLFRFKRY